MIFAYLNHWQLFEQDAFWLTRAGEEILQTHKVQTADSWTHTSHGARWENIQWLTSITFAVVKKIGSDITALVWLRSVLTFIFFFICGLIVWRAPVTSSVHWLSRNLSLLLLLPWLYLMNWLRFQMRPDFFGIVFFSGLVYLLTKYPLTKKLIYWALLLLVIWANFHAGTVVMGIFLLGMAILLSSTDQFSWRKKCQWMFLILLCWFATPQYFHIIRVFFETAQVEGNPDLQPFSLKFLTFREGGFTYILFWVYWFICVGGYVFLNQLRKNFPPLYSQKKFVYSVLVGFTYLFLMRQRTIPYLTIFLLPIACTLFTWIANVIFSGSYPVKRRVGAVATFAVALAVFWGWMIPTQKQINVPLGRKVSESFMPVKSVEFIDYARPDGQLYNHFNFGGYVIYMLHDYPVFYDGRETPFSDLSKERRVAARNPQSYGYFLRKYNINTVLETLPQGDRIKEYSVFYPHEEWARVFSDITSTVYVRRIPDHETIISMYEKTGGSIQDTSKKPDLTQDQIQKLLREAQDEIKRRESNK